MKKDWRKHVHTESTFPPPGTFTKKAREVARIMADPRVSPKGLGSAIKMITYYLNRGGAKISHNQRQELEHARSILQERSRHK